MGGECKNQLTHRKGAENAENAELDRTRHLCVKECSKWNSRLPLCPC